MTTNAERAPSGQALAVPATPLRVDGPSGFDPSRLERYIATIREKWGTPEQQLAREGAVSRFLADLPKTTRVFCRGEVRTDKGCYPAALTINTIYGQVLAWAASGRKDAVEAHSPSLFFSHIPYSAIAKEVLDYPETTAIATEARRAETVKQGSVHEGAGRNGIAQRTAP